MDNKYHELDLQTAKYKKNYKQFGYDEKTLFMPSDRRNIRYYELLKHFIQMKQGQKFSLLDAGCGFGDVNAFLIKIIGGGYDYLGVDVVDDFITEGKKRYGNEHIHFSKHNFITDEIENFEYDYAISSQAFNTPYTNKSDNYDEIVKSVTMLYDKCKQGVSFNFFTDKVQFKKEGTCYHSPAKLLDFAYSLSHNVYLDNGCMPFEATITILKDNSRDQNGMIFDRYCDHHRDYFDQGIFVVKRK